MLPILTFASGLVVGALGLRLLKSAKPADGLRTSVSEGYETVATQAREGLDKTQATLRRTTISGLSALERSAAGLRTRLEEDPAPVETPAEEAAPKAKKARAPRKTAAKRTKKAATPPPPPEAAPPTPEADS